jgi:DNA-binding NtrC family response regulator
MWPLNHHHRQESRSVKVPAATPRLLAVLTDVSDQEAVKEFAASSNWDLHAIPTVERAAISLSGEVVSVILLDRDLAGPDWRVAVQAFASLTPKPSIILASSVVDHYLFTEVVHHGGYDVISKPLHADELRRILGLAFSFWKNRVLKIS